MKTLLFTILTIQLGAAFVANAADLSTIETVQGKTYRRCTIMKRDPDGVYINHSAGVAKILFTDLTESQRLDLGYDARKAEAYDKERADARKEAAEARQARDLKIAEAYAAARAKLAAQRPLVLMQQPDGYNGLVPLAPVLGLGQLGYPGSAYHGGFHRRGSQGRGWSGGGIAKIGAGTGGVYAPQSGGLTFYGFPGVTYSPTLGYTNTFSNSAALGFFGTQHSGTVPGVAVRGSASIPAPR